MTGAGGFRPVHPGSWTAYSCSVRGERAGPELCTGTLVHGRSTSGTSSNLTTQGIPSPNAIPLGAGRPLEDSGGGGHRHFVDTRGSMGYKARLRPRPCCALFCHLPWEQAVGLGGAPHPKEEHDGTVLVLFCTLQIHTHLDPLHVVQGGHVVASPLERGCSEPSGLGSGRGAWERSPGGHAWS